MLIKKRQILLAVIGETLQKKMFKKALAIHKISHFCNEEKEGISQRKET